MAYKCRDCGCVFDEPKKHYENHGYYGFGSYILEPMMVCPNCGECGYDEYDEYADYEEEEEDDYDE